MAAQKRLEAEETGGQAETADREGVPGAKGLAVETSPDLVEAYLKPDGNPLGELTLEGVKALLREKGVIHGVVDDEVLRQYLEGGPDRRPPLLVALGQAPSPAAPPQIKCHFDKDPVGTFKVKKNGQIDFRDRGEVPQVKEGDLLAEIVPGRAGQNGIDVYGRTIPGPAPRDMKIICGQGAKKSENGLKAYASRAGRPEIGPDGRIFVFPYYEINGDVNYETGHVVFDGHVSVRGSIQEGFKVQAGSLTAEEIQGAEIDVVDHVVVVGGVISGKLKVGGNLRAKYVQGAEIVAMGDVLVDNEIRHSRIETNGTCLVRNGAVLDSVISARKGMATVDLGSTASKPSTITVGVDETIRRTINQLKTELAEMEEWGRAVEKERGALQDELGKIEDRIGEMITVWDTAEERQIKLSEKIVVFQQTNDIQNFQKAQKGLERLEQTREETQNFMEKLADAQEVLMSDIQRFEAELQRTEALKEEQAERIDAMIEWSLAEKSSPTLKVRGQVAAGTVVRGVHASVTIKEDKEFVTFKETKRRSQGRRATWEIDIS
jgi:hypothetical protein